MQGALANGAMPAMGNQYGMASHGGMGLMPPQAYGGMQVRVESPHCNDSVACMSL